MTAIKARYSASQDVDLKAEHLDELAKEFLAIVSRHTGKPFPEDPYQQLEIAHRRGIPFVEWQSAPSTTADSSRSPKKWPAVPPSMW